MSGSKSSGPSSDAAGSPKHDRDDDHLLGMTVHTLPQAGNAMADAERSAKGRLKMLAVMLVCAAPVIASYFTYYVIRPEGRRNYGELIDPQRTLPTATAQKLDGSPLPLPTLKGQWLLVSVAGGACDAQCQQHLYFQRQLREGLGREKDRLDWVWLISDETPIDAALLPAVDKATVLRVPDSVLTQWLAPTNGHALKDHLYVVDPMGNWMMRFPAQMDVPGAAKAKKDLERLLRASSSWDRPGREGQP
jgi:hypothetical protein